jgi:hypothetical protein
LLAAGLLLVTGVAAQPYPAKSQVADGPAWGALSPLQQSALAPLKRDWAVMDEARKQKWLEIAARFPTMPVDEQQRVQARMTEWSRMTPDERGRARLQFQQARQISPQQRQSRWDAYLALPEAERRALAKSAGTVPKTASANAAPGNGKPTAATLGRPAPKAAGAKTDAVKAELKPVAPTVVQAKPGASTTLISNTAKPPPLVKAGEPKSTADQGAVNRSTLLPQTAPPAAASATR